MTMPVSAANAYTQAARLINPADSRDKPASTAGADFSNMVQTAVEGFVDSGRQTEAAAMNLAKGNANVVDVVTAVAETEVALETMVSVRDRVISAYQEIMRMPI